MLRLELFGEPRVLRHGQAITRFESKRALALLAYLALFPDKRHSRESLVDQIWPDASLESGRNRLKQALASIRRIVEPPGFTPGSVIDADRTYIGLRSGSLSCDVLELRAAMKRGDIETSKAMLRGDLMPGFFDEWLEDIRYEVATYEVDLESEPTTDLTSNDEGIASQAYRIAIPAAVTTFIGREKEIQAVVEALRKTRLVTVTGFGGLGKTRLTQQVGRLWDKGDVIFVPLANVTSSDEIVPTILRSLGAEPSPISNPFDDLRLAISKENCLLILDNLEQLASPKSNEVMIKILEQNPRVQILSSSRIPLKIDGETDINLWPLETPNDTESLEELTKNESLQLFVDRARQARADFQITENNRGNLLQICDRLNGIPLAIELCAAWSHFGVKRMLEMLQDGTETIESRRKSPTDRHSSLKIVFHSTVELLDSKAKELLGQLSVLRGTWNWNFIQQVWPDLVEMSTLSALIEASLVRPHYEHEPTKFELLESIQQFASALLEDDKRTEIRVTFARSMAKLAAASKVIQQEPQFEIEDQAGWIAFLEDNWLNFRQAAVILQDSGLEDELVELAWNTEWYWSVYGGDLELPRIAGTCNPKDKCNSIKANLLVTSHLTSKDTDASFSSEFDTIIKRAIDANDTQLVAEAHLRRAKLRLSRQDMEHVMADAKLAKDYFEGASNDLGTGQALHIIANSYIQAGQNSEVHACLEEAARLFTKCKSQVNLAAVSYSRARHHYMNKRFEEALTVLYQCRNLGKGLRNFKFMGRTANFMGVVLRNLEQEEPARVYFYLSIIANVRTREIRGSHMPLWNLYLSLGQEQRWQQAVPIMATSMAIWVEYFMTDLDDHSQSLLDEFSVSAKEALGSHKYIALEAQGKPWTLEEVQTRLAKFLQSELKTHQEEIEDFFGPRAKI